MLAVEAMIFRRKRNPETYPRKSSIKLLTTCMFVFLAILFFNSFTYLLFLFGRMSKSHDYSGGNLYGTTGLPLAPFATDMWQYPVGYIRQAVCRKVRQTACLHYRPVRSVCSKHCLSGCQITNLVVSEPDLRIYMPDARHVMFFQCHCKRCVHVCRICLFRTLCMCVVVWFCFVFYRYGGVFFSW